MGDDVMGTLKGLARFVAELHKRDMAVSENMKVCQKIDGLRFIRRYALETRERHDFVWRIFLMSMATWGRNNWSRLENRYDREVSPDVLECRSPAELRVAISNWLDGTRWAKSDANKEKAAQTFEKLCAEFGSIRKASAAARRLEGYAPKRDFLSNNFTVLMREGNPKYQRNFWMDVYDPDFLDRFAIDARICGILRLLKDLPEPLRPSLYHRGGKNVGKPAPPAGENRFEAIEHWLNENLVPSVARHLNCSVGCNFETEVSSWKVDRLLFQNVKHISQEL